MVEGNSAARRQDGIRCARIAPALALLLTAALAAPAPALARDPDRTQRGTELWDAYPLRAAKGTAAPAPPDRATGAASTQMAAAPSDDVERLVLACVFALLAGGIASWLVSLRGPRARVTSMGATAARPDPAPARSSAPELWLHGAGAPAPAPPPEPAAVATPPRAARPPGAPAPPEPGRAWAAEIDWHLAEGASQFCVAARPVDGGGPITLAASALLEWPPRGARSVQALTDAVRALETRLVAVGWTPLPRGSAWYAKRFTWQPGARPRTAPAIAGRTRHRKLYETEYARHVDQTERLRRTISARLIQEGRGGSAAAIAPE